jgi:hypothetical protein
MSLRRDGGNRAGIWESGQNLVEPMGVVRMPVGDEDRLNGLWTKRPDLFDDPARRARRAAGVDQDEPIGLFYHGYIARWLGKEFWLQQRPDAFGHLSPLVNITGEFGGEGASRSNGGYGK